MKKAAFEWYAILEGCFLAALGLFFLQSSGLLVGGTGGIAAISNKVLNLSFGTWFFLINLPFFLVAFKQMGKSFTLKSLFGIFLVSVLTDALGLIINISAIPIWLAAFIGGGLIGIGLLILFRHNTSLGGVNILALYVERRFNIHSGKIILTTDMLVVAFAFMFYPPQQVVYSIIGFVVLTSVIGRYHKKAPITQQTSVLKEADSEVQELELATKSN